MNKKAMLTLVAVFAAFAVAAASQSSAAPAAPQAPGGNVQDGGKLFALNGCYECHGRAAQGAASGPRLARYPAALAVFTAYVRHPRGDMPPYTAKVLSDKDAGDIYAFLKSIPQPKPVTDIPLLNQ